MEMARSILRLRYSLQKVQIPDGHRPERVEKLLRTKSTIPIQTTKINESSHDHGTLFVLSGMKSRLLQKEVKDH